MLLVAKLDIASDSDSEGRGFKSLRAGHQIKRSVFMTFYGIASILLGVVYFFGSFCPTVKKFCGKIKDTFFQSSDKKSDEKSDEDKNPKEKDSIPKKIYNVAEGTGESILKLLKVGREGFITSYIMFGTSMDEKGEIKLWNWFEEAEKIHKGVKSGSIFNEKNIANIQPKETSEEEKIEKIVDRLLNKFKNVKVIENSKEDTKKAEKTDSNNDTMEIDGNNQVEDQNKEKVAGDIAQVAESA